MVWRIAMDLFKRFKKRNIGFIVGGGDGSLCSGYTTLDRVPEVVAACNRIAELVSSITIHLMANTENGDIRIVNELSRKIDINPEKNMTRSTWMHGIVMDMQLYGAGNAIVLPHTRKGYLENLEPISAQRVGFKPIGFRDYKVLIDGAPKDPKNLLHFVLNPDKLYKWKGQGYQASIMDLAKNLKQASATSNAFLSSKWKPSVIVKVDAFTDEFASPAGRQKLLDSYVKSADAGEPWLIPADQFEVEQVKPLSLRDLAISDSVTLDRKMVAALIGIPAFLLGVGEYSQSEYNSFIQNKIMTIVKSIMQEMTKKLIISEKMYLEGNVWSLMDYDLNTVSSVLLAGADRGYINGNEWRGRMHFDPKEGLNEYKVLENYIPADMSGNQKKLVQEDET